MTIVTLFAIRRTAPPPCKDVPDLTGYSIKAYTCLSRSKLNEDDRRLIAEKLFVTTKFWYVRALIFAVKGELQAGDTLLPEVAL